MDNNTRNHAEQLLTQSFTIVDSHDRSARATGSRFNVFSVLQRERNEVITHV